MLARLIGDLRPGLIGLQEVHAAAASGDLGQAGELSAARRRIQGLVRAGQGRRERRV